MTPDRVAAMQAAIDAGTPIAQVSREFCTSRPTVYAYCTPRKR